MLLFLLQISIHFLHIFPPLQYNLLSIQAFNLVSNYFFFLVCTYCCCFCRDLVIFPRTMIHIYTTARKNVAQLTFTINVVEWAERIYCEVIFVSLLVSDNCLCKNCDWWCDKLSSVNRLIRYKKYYTRWIVEYEKSLDQWKYPSNGKLQMDT